MYVCTLCIVHVGFNTTVILVVIFQFIKICFVIGMAVMDSFLFLTQSHILLTEVVMCAQG